jgi:large subunit ribosomal protein L6
MWGLTRVLISNMIKGVSEGFQKQLELEGLGFRVQLSGEVLSLHVGFSHPVKIEAPPGIKFSTEKNIITVSGIDKELVGQTAAIIRKVKLPEPYKGKGIKYLGEQIRKKVGKKAVATAGAK